MSVNKYLVTGKFYLILFCGVVLLTACETKPDRDNDADQLQLYPEDMELKADTITIWWDESFGVPYNDFAETYLDKAFEDTEFKFHSFIRPMSRSPRPENDFFQMLTSSSRPDLIVFGNRYLPLLLESDYLTPVDIESFLDTDSAAMDEIRNAAPDLQLYALPFGRNVSALFYNKTIFDQMQVEYPRDGMTWSETTELARQARKADSWTALDVANSDLIASQINLRIYNAEKQTVDLETKEWESIIQFTDIQRSLNDREKKFTMSSFGVGSAAMVAGSMFGETPGTQGLYDVLSNLKLFDVEWDAVSYPVFEDSLLAPAHQTLYIGVPRSSSNTEDALQVIRYLLSKNIQYENMQKGLLSLRGDTDALLEEMESASHVYSRLFKSYRNIDSVGSFDPILDNMPYTIRIMWLINETSHLLNYAIESHYKSLPERIANYLNERLNVIEEVKRKF